MSPPLPRIVVVGAGAAGWMAAAALARAFHGAPGVVKVVSAGGEDAETGHAVAALPAARRLHRFIGLSEDELMERAQGVFRLGIALQGWGEPSAQTLLPFGEVGAAFGPTAFHHMLVRRARLGRAEAASDYAMAALAARAGRFRRPSGDPRSVESTLDYGLHLASAGYAAALRTCAERQGAVAVGPALAGVELEGACGAARCLRLEDGAALEADLYLDCSGQRAAVIGEAVGSAWQDWPWARPFDRRVEALFAEPEGPRPVTEIAAAPAGWLRRTPLAGATALSFGYSSQALDEAGALERLLESGGHAGAEPRRTAIACGRRTAPWSGNCVALGAAAACADPLGLAGLHLVQTGVERLIALFPYSRNNAAAAAAYNRQAGAEAERLGDFALALFKTNGRLGEPAWDLCRSAEPPPSLARKLALFESRGRTPMLEDEPFPEAAWAALLLGQGVRPRRYDPFADSVEEAQLEDTLGRIRHAMQAAVQAMPPYGRPLREAPEPAA